MEAGKINWKLKEQIYLDRKSDLSSEDILLLKMEVLGSYSDESLLLLDKELRVVLFNDRFAELNSKYLKLNVVQGNSIFDYVRPERIDWMKQVYASVLKGETRKTEVEFINNGNLISYCNKYKPYYLENGEVGGVVVLSTEQTEQKINYGKVKLDLDL
jgi:hypothetical protein